jgi:hypothetical protein
MFQQLINMYRIRHILILTLVALLAGCSQSVAAPLPTLIRFQPALAQKDAPQPANPLRGLYRWNEQEIAPLAYPTLDSYKRYSWRELEPAAGQYDFGAIDQAIAKASQQGQRHAFRVRAMINGKGIAVPDYLAAQMEAGWWGDTNGDGKGDTYVPDWNDADFHERLERLTIELGKRYNGDPRVAWVDVGFFGNWGEWHMWPFLESYPRPEGAKKATEASKQRIIDAMASAFNRTQLIMGSEEIAPLLYALRTYPTMGWRRDSLGDTHFTEGAGMRRLREDPEGWALFTERWKTAPIITEFISPNDQTDPHVYELATKQVKEFHVSMVSNGNTLPWDSLSQAGQTTFLQLQEQIGYSYALTEVTMLAPLQVGKPLTLQAGWHNIGNAPTYEPWQIMFQLRNPTTQTLVWETPSHFDLRQLLPGENGQQWEDTFTLPTGLAAGSYEFVVQVRDPAGQRVPMALALSGLQTDRSYILGTINVIQ